MEEVSCIAGRGSLGPPSRARANLVPLLCTGVRLHPRTAPAGADRQEHPPIFRCPGVGPLS